MEIEIYQINTERDKDDLCFMNTDFLKRKNITEIPARIYDKVFDGTVNCQTLRMCTASSISSIRLDTRAVLFRFPTLSESSVPNHP